MLPHLHHGMGAPASAAQRVVTDFNLMAHISSFQDGFPLVVRPLTEPPFQPLPHDRHHGLCVTRAVQAGDLVLVATIHRILSRHPEYVDSHDMAFDTVLTAAIATGNMAILTWIDQHSSALVPSFCDWRQLRLAYIQERIKSDVLAWLSAHHPESFHDIDNSGLRMVIHRGDLDLLRCYHQHRPDVYHVVVRRRDWDLIATAMAVGHLHIVQFLCEDVGLQLEGQLEHVAKQIALTRHFVLLEYLLKRVVDDRIRDRIVSSVLRGAADHDWPDVIDFFMSRSEQHGGELLMAAVKTRRLDVLNELVRRSPPMEPTLLTDALRLAAKSDDVEVVQCLVKAFDFVRGCLESSKEYCRWEANSGKPRILFKRPVTKAIKGLLKRTGTIKAPKTVAFLVRHLDRTWCALEGRDVPPVEETVEETARNALTFAVADQDAKLLLLLYEHDVPGFTSDLVDQAEVLGHTDVVEFLVDRLGLPRPPSMPVDETATDEDPVWDEIDRLGRRRHWPWEFSLINAWRDVATAGNEEMLELLLQSTDGTPSKDLAFVAAHSGNVAALCWLLEHHIGGEICRSAIESVARDGSVEVIQVLFQQHRALFSSHVVKLAARSAELLTFFAANGRGITFEDSRSIVQDRDCPYVIDYLCETHATKPTFAAHMETLMSLACEHGHLQVVQALIRHRAIQSDHMLRFMVTAAEGGHVDILRCLYDTIDTLHMSREEFKCVVVAAIHESTDMWSEPRCHPYETAKFIVEAEAPVRDQVGLWDLVDAIVTSPPYDPIRPNRPWDRLATPAITYLLNLIHAASQPDTDPLSIKMPDTLEAETEAEAEEALRVAVLCGRLDVIRFVHVGGGKGLTSTLLDHAVIEGQLSIVQFLIESRGLKCSDTALAIAKAKGHHTVVAWIESVRGYVE